MSDRLSNPGKQRVLAFAGAGLKASISLYTNQLEWGLIRSLTGATILANEFHYCLEKTHEEIFKMIKLSLESRTAYF